jgi:hypothetical protein
MATPMEPLKGRRIVLTGLVGAGLGLAVSVFLQTVVRNTPVSVTSYAVFWFRILLASFGGLGGMALETVRQLQATNPDPAYHKPPLRQQHPPDRR